MEACRRHPWRRQSRCGTPHRPAEVRANWKKSVCGGHGCHQLWVPLSGCGDNLDRLARLAARGRSTAWAPDEPLYGQPQRREGGTARCPMPGLSAPWMAPTSLQGRIHGVSRHRAPWRPTTLRMAPLWAHWEIPGPCQPPGSVSALRAANDRRPYGTRRHDCSGALRVYNARAVARGAATGSAGCSARPHRRCGASGQARHMLPDNRARRLRIALRCLTTEPHHERTDQAGRAPVLHRG